MIIRHRQSEILQTHVDLSFLADSFYKHKRKCWFWWYHCREWAEENADEIYNVLSNYRDSDTDREIFVMNGKLTLKMGDHKVWKGPRAKKTLFVKAYWSSFVISPNFFTKQNQPIQLVIRA